jgi:hypothetical protein
MQEFLAVRADALAQTKHLALMKACELTYLHRHFRATQVYPDSRVVLEADVRLHLQESRWKRGFRGEAAVGLSSRGLHRALGLSTRVGVLRHACRIVFRPAFLAHELHEKSHVCLSASVTLVVNDPFGISRDRRDFSDHHAHHGIRNRLARGHDWSRHGKVVPKQREQGRQSMLNQQKAGRLGSLCVREECQAHVVEDNLWVHGSSEEVIDHGVMECVRDGRTRDPWMIGLDRCRVEGRLLVLEFRHVQCSFHVKDQDQTRRIQVKACLHQIAIVVLEVHLRRPCWGL